MKYVSFDSAELLSVAVSAAHIGGEVLQNWRGRFTVREKSRANLVTEADEDSQRAIVESIRSQFPDHSFLAEESLSTETAQDRVLWIIDPLDGTQNYVHGFPYYAVSIAAMLNGELLAGVVFDPTRNEAFTATRGGGAHLNGHRIEVSGEREIGQTFGMASLPVGGSSENPAVARFLAALPRLQTVQRTGSAALNLAFVASGRVDAFWSTSLKPWDVAAGVLLVQEAGGTASDLEGGPIDIFASNLLVTASPQIQQDLIQILKVPELSE